MIKDFLEIYWKFFKMGAVTFGGGYAMLPILRREVVENSHWMKEEDILDYCVVALIVDAVIGMWKKGVKDILGVIICLSVLALSLFTKISPVLLVIACAVIGIVSQSVRRAAKVKQGGDEK